MIRYLHRANDFVSILRATNAGFGIEVDIRTHHGRCFLSHDVIEDNIGYIPLEDLISYIKYHRVPTIFDIKESGLIHLLDIKGVQDLVYAVDLIVPDQKYIIDADIPLRSLSRRSMYEVIHGVGTGYWLDYVTTPSDIESYPTFSNTIIVSPELHNAPLTSEFIQAIREVHPMGICTDFPEKYT